MNLDGVSLKALQKEFEVLVDGYRSGKPAPIDSRERALAYVLYRAPATMGVLSHLLQNLPPLQSVCDCGSGAGVSYEPLQAHSPGCSITFLEQSKILIELGKEQAGQYATWKNKNFTKASFTPHDLFLFSYSLNEDHSIHAVRKAFQMARYVLIIEPGTPAGYKRVLAYREALLNDGAYMVGPCPHANDCPLSGGDWCHFSERISRSKEHKYIKKSSMGYEDEKYSYLLVSKKEHPLFERILREPQKNKQGIRFKICGFTGLREQDFPKRSKEVFTKVKKLGWGDTIPYDIME